MTHQFLKNFPLFELKMFLLPFQMRITHVGVKYNMKRIFVDVELFCHSLSTIVCRKLY